MGSGAETDLHPGRPRQQRHRGAPGFARQVHRRGDGPHDARGQDDLGRHAEARGVSLPAGIRSASPGHAAAAAGSAATARSRDRSLVLRDQPLIAYPGGTMRLGIIVLTTCVFALPMNAQRPAPATAPAERDTTKAVPTPIPNEMSSVTDHTIRVGGQLVPYRATAATMLLKNDKEESVGVLYYTAYTRSDAKDPSQRPLAFVYTAGRDRPRPGCTWVPSAHAAS